MAPHPNRRDARAGPATGETAGGRAARTRVPARQRVADRGGTRLEHRSAAIGRWPPLRAGDDLVGPRPDAGRGAWRAPRPADVGVEAMPLYWQYRPTETVGVAVSPLVWRWRFVPRGSAAAFAELAFGGLFTADPVPEGTEAANFLTHGAFGIRWRPGRRDFVGDRLSLSAHLEREPARHEPRCQRARLWMGVRYAAARRLAAAASARTVSVIFVPFDAARLAARCRRAAAPVRPASTCPPLHPARAR